ncbi:hypothetical protein GY45DRAFT_368579 [Cubamyces sp. BRFM 1775]|nr:hypothetical protein GY45DRAFT_368579 [Cubamyces sp. BRFM 1775]
MLESLPALSLRPATCTKRTMLMPSQTTTPCISTPLSARPASPTNAQLARTNRIRSPSRTYAQQQTHATSPVAESLKTIKHGRREKRQSLRSSPSFTLRPAT